MVKEKYLLKNNESFFFSTYPTIFQKIDDVLSAEIPDNQEKLFNYLKTIPRNIALHVAQNNIKKLTLSDIKYLTGYIVGRKLSLIEACDKLSLNFLEIMS